ncbi:MAG: SH3 domain-containing protein [Candidatus Latescibacterota bacterium]|jgi:tetratricopeptide (TPR) repeat protein
MMAVSDSIFRRTFVTIFAAALIIPVTAAASIQTPPNPENEAAIAYQTGLEAYLAGDYEGALDNFLTAEASGKTSGELLYNLGNTYFRLNNLGKAVLYYERARRLMPTDDLLNHSIRIARRKTMNRFARIPRPIWSKYWTAVVARLGPGWMFFVGLCFYFTAVVFLGFRIWTKSRNDWLRRGLALSMLGAIFFIAAAFLASRDRASTLTAVVQETSVDLRDSPSPVGEVETTVYEGLVVHIVDESESWLQVRLPDGTTGWVEGMTVEVV